MLGPSDKELPSKCYLTKGILPQYSDPDQLPSKNKPFSTIVDQKLSHSVDLILPEKFFKTAWLPTAADLKPVRYSRVILRLSDILSKDFLNVYIKTGNIALQSEGRAGHDPIYTLHEGVLRFELPKELYERAGLVGQPVRDGGRKHMKVRYAVELNLRLPSMFPGRKLFDRLLWATKHALVDPITFLFIDLQSSNPFAADLPVAAHHPVNFTTEPQSTTIMALIPPMNISDAAPSDDPLIFQDDALGLLEWLDLVRLQSPRVDPEDKVDPFLARYAVPGRAQTTVSRVIKVSWRGILPGTWTRDLLVRLLNLARKDNSSWFALSGHGFRRQAVDARLGWTILRLPEQTADEQNADMVMEDDGDEVEHELVSKKTRNGNRPRAVSKPAPRYLLYEMTAGQMGS